MYSDSPGKHVLASLAVIAVVALATISAYAHQRAAALPTLQDVPGTCQVDQDPAEFATLSDTSPAVPCDQPHQTETAFVLPITGDLAGQAARPNPELLTATYSQQCADYLRIRKFLGARAPDVYWGISTLARYPTPSEWWSHDVRVVVCQLYASAPSGMSLTQDLAGILTRHDSAAFRQCRLGTTFVTCDQVHNAEATSPNAVLPAGGWPGTAAETVEAVRACTPAVDAYLDGPIASKRNLFIDPSPLTAAQWDAGNHSVDCWIATSGGPATGTVRGGLK